MGLLDTIKANRANAEKASALDGLEKQYLVNQVRDQTTKSNMEELARYMAPLREQYSQQVLNQNADRAGLAGSGVEKIPYHDGMSVPDSIVLGQLLDAENRQINRDESTLRNLDWNEPQVKDAIMRVDDRVYNGLAAQGYK